MENSNSMSSKKFGDTCKNIVVGGATGAIVGGNVGKIFGVPGATAGALVGSGLGAIVGIFEDD